MEENGCEYGSDEERNPNMHYEEEVEQRVSQLELTESKMNPNKDECESVHINEIEPQIADQPDVVQKTKSKSFRDEIINRFLEGHSDIKNEMNDEEEVEIKKFFAGTFLLKKFAKSEQANEKETWPNDAEGENELSYSKMAHKWNTTHFCKYDKDDEVNKSEGSKVAERYSLWIPTGSFTQNHQVLQSFLACCKKTEDNPE
jgi:hypothetical protein